MADKKISELPILGYSPINTTGDITASGVGVYPQNIVPVVVGGTTYQISLQNFSRYVTQYNATTGSNTFIGNQTVQGNITTTGNLIVQGKLTAQEVHTEITSASIIFESGSTIFGNSGDDTHQFTGVVSINGITIGAQAVNDFTASTDAQLRRVYQTTSSLNIFTGSQDNRNFVISEFTSSTDAHIVGISTYTSSLEAQLRRVYQTTSSLNIFTGSQDSRNFVISQFTASTDAHIVGISTYTSSLEAQLRRVYQTTSSLNIFTGSQDSRNFVISQFTSSTDAHIVGISDFTSSQLNVNLGNSVYTSSLESHLRRVYQTTSSLNIFTGSQDSRNFVISQFTASTDNHILGISIYTASINASIVNASAVTASIFAQLERVYQTTSSLNIFTGSQDSRNLTISQFTSSTDAHIVGISAFTSSQLAVNLGNSIFTSSARIELNSIEAYTSSLKAAISVSGTNVQIIGDLNVNKLNVQYISSSVLVTSGSNVFGDQSTDKHEFTGSVYLQNSLLLGTEVLGNAGLNSFTASTNNSIVGVSAFTSSQLNVNLGNAIFTSSARIELNSIEAYTASLKTAAIVSSSTQVQNYDLFALNSNLYNGTGSLQAQLNGLMGFTASLDNTYATDVQLLPILQATRSLELHSGSMVGITNELMALTASMKGQAIVSSSTQVQNYDVFALNSNLYNSTGSIKGEIAGIEAYTASLKGAAIVSSSQQIQNYNLFAYNTVTSSAATIFYGKVSIATTQSAAPLTIKEQGTPGAELFRYYGNISNGDYMRGYWISQDGATSLAQLTVNGNVDMIVGTSTTAPLKLHTNSATAVEINYLAGANFTGAVTASNFKVPSGGGLDFSATSNGSGTTTSELLNDYEEGTWTPTITFGGGATSLTYNTQYGVYTKIGNVVHFSFRVILSNKGSSTGAAAFGGLPFTSANTNGNFGAVPVAFADAVVSFDKTLTWIVDPNATTINVRYCNGTNYADMNDTNFTNSSNIIASGTYRTA